MEIRVLRYFLTVAREESITRAAEVLHITQPTLSRQLSQLEEETGVRLLERGPRRIRLTSEGMLLRRRAEEILELVDKTEAELSEQDELVEGRISIGCGELASVSLLPELFRSFRERHPRVGFDLYTATADLVTEQMDRGLLDIGLLTEPVDISKYNFIRLRRKERWGVLVRKDSALVRKKSVTPQDLLDVPVFLVQRPLVKNELEGWFGDYYDQIHVIGTYNLINNVAVMVERKIGVALCFHLQNRFDELKYIPLSPAMETGAVIVWKKAQIVSPTIRQFISFIKENRVIQDGQEKES